MPKWINVCLPLCLALWIGLPGCKKDELDRAGLEWVDCSQGNSANRIYYVSNNGDDRNDGTSPATAFRTVKHALSVALPGNTVRILPGTYYESLGIEDCGTDNAPTIIEGWQGVPVFDGEQKRAIGIYCNQCRNFRFRNMHFTNYRDAGLLVTNSNHINIHDIIASENGHDVILESWQLEGYGIHIDNSVHFIIHHCKVYRNGPSPQVFPDYLMGTGINTYGNRNGVISNNECFENTGGGILIEDSYQITADSNDIHHNDCDASIDQWWDAGLWIDGGANISASYNHFHHNLGPGIEISDEEIQHPYGYHLVNNVSDSNYYGIFIWNFGTNDWPDSTILLNRGNVFEHNTRKDVWIADWY